jgi:hypothetical protein
MQKIRLRTRRAAACCWMKLEVTVTPDASRPRTVVAGPDVGWTYRCLNGSCRSNPSTARLGTV